MNERIERLREELERARQRKIEADQRVKNCEVRLRNAENNQFISDIRKLELSPEEVSLLITHQAELVTNKIFLIDENLRLQLHYFRQM